MQIQREDLSFRVACRQRRARGYPGSRDCAVDSADTRANAWRQCNDSRRDARGAAQCDSTAAAVARSQVLSAGAGRVHASRLVAIGGPADDGARLHIRRRPRRHHDDIVDPESRRLPSLRLGRVVFAGEQMGRGAQRGDFHTNPESLRSPLFGSFRLSSASGQLRRGREGGILDRSYLHARTLRSAALLILELQCVDRRQERALIISRCREQRSQVSPVCNHGKRSSGNSVSSAEAVRLDRTHQHGNALVLAIAPIYPLRLTGRDKTDRTAEAATFELLDRAAHNLILPPRSRRAENYKPVVLSYSRAKQASKIVRRRVRRKSSSSRRRWAASV